MAPAGTSRPTAAMVGPSITPVLSPNTRSPSKTRAPVMVVVMTFPS